MVGKFGHTAVGIDIDIIKLVLLVACTGYC